jgi:hypothetical protein
MKPTANLSNFLSKGATVFFAGGTDNTNVTRSRVGKAALALSLAGAVGLATPSAAEARGGGLAIGLIGGMMLGSMMARSAAVAAPVASYPAAAYPTTGYPATAYPTAVPVAPVGLGTGGQPGTYLCPHGPQHRCFWVHGELEIHDEGVAPEKAAEMDNEAPSFKMG